MPIYPYNIYIYCIAYIYIYVNIPLYPYNICPIFLQEAQAKAVRPSPSEASFAKPWGFGVWGLVFKVWGLGFRV